MKWIKKKESWSRFGLKALIVVMVIALAGGAFASRYRIGIDTQLVKCIPGYSIYLIDRKDRGLEKGAIYAFAAQGLNPLYEDGTQMVKYLRGEPGDHVSVGEHGIKVNGLTVGQGLTHAETLGVPPASFTGEAVLKDDNYWFMGTSDESFDSRYWGTVNDDQVIGRAYPIF